MAITPVVVMFSGGAASYVAALRAKDAYPQASITLLFCDTLMEDEDTYRFLDDAAQRLALPVTRIADGRTPWQVFYDERFLGNTRADPCSKILKRQLARKWVEAHMPDGGIIVLGLDACELQRIPRVQQAWKPYQVVLPLLWSPPMDKDLCRALIRRSGLQEPRLYALGFPHNNCGGFCVKGGQAHFAHLLTTLPDRYAWHEAQESALRAALGKDVAILRDRRGGKTRPLTLTQLRTHPLSARQKLDWGGCGCFVDPSPSEDAP